MSDDDKPETIEGTATDENGVAAPAEMVKAAEGAIAVPAHGRPDYRLAMELGRTMSQSGYFDDVKAEAQAAVKMVIGLDLGVSPTAAMSAVHIVDGKPVIGFQILASKIIEHPHYGYRIDAHDDDRCVVIFHDDRLGTPKVEGDPEADPPVFPRDANEIDRVEWTLERAKDRGIATARSGELKANWRRSARNMLFARCIADGTRWYMPDLLTGAAVYVEGEIGDEDREPLTPPVERPPALADDRAETLRRQIREAYSELRAMNAELLPPGAFQKQLRDAEHSHEALATLLDTVTDLRDVQKQIDETAAKLSDDTLEGLSDKLRRARGQRGRLEVLAAAVAEQEKAAESAEDDDGEGASE